MIKFPSNKEALRHAVDLLVLEFLERGGVITVCPPGWARGAR